MKTHTYIPGVCNIGETEIKMRKRLGWIALIITIALWIVLDLLHVPKAIKLVIFLPAAMSATGFIQGFSHFCAGFGMKGVFNFGDKLNVTDTVEQAEYRAQDKKKAMAIFGYSILAGVIVATVAYFF